jgi:hypothetical protein
MPATANTRPRFFKEANNQYISGITTALSAANLTSGTLDTNVWQAWVADATNDGWCVEIRCKPQPINNTAATIMRAYLNNGSTIATAANSSFLDELQIPATTASTTVPTPTFVLPIARHITFGHRVLVTFSVAPGGSGAFDLIGIGYNL